MMASPVSSNDNLLSNPMPNLFATTTAPLPFMANVVVRSFILQNVDDLTVIYNSPSINNCADSIRKLGEPSKLLVNHWHEAMYGQSQQFAMPTYVSQADRSQTEPQLPITDTLENITNLGQNIEAIPTPGHTLGATAFLWTNGNHRYLFSGDSIWLHNERWEAVVIGESDRQLYLQSLEMLAELDFDVLVPWVSMQGQPFIDEVTPQQKQQQLGAMIQRLRTGENQ